jgi:hypothetical protein
MRAFCLHQFRKCYMKVHRTTGSCVTVIQGEINNEILRQDRGAGGVRGPGAVQCLPDNPRWIRLSGLVYQALPIKPRLRPQPVSA